MMYPKPRSAPGRIVQSKFVKNRTNAMKEIEAWVKKDDTSGAHEASRMSGQLTDNVTEERMLRAKLWELSKERYKFLTQSAYEKKMFTDRMQRKSSAMTRRASSAAPGCSGGRDSGGSATPAKQRWKNARLALIDRLTPAKKKDKAEDSDAAVKEKSGGATTSVRKNSGTGSRGRLTPAATPISVAPAASGAVMGSGRVVLAPLPVSPSGMGRDEQVVFQKPPPSPAVPTNSRNVKFGKDSPSTTNPRDSSAGRPTGFPSPMGGRGARGSPLTSPGAVGVASSFPGRPPASNSSKPTSATSLRSNPIGGAQATSSSALYGVPSMANFAGGKRGMLANRFGMRLESKTADPRYAQLEHSLSPIQRQRCGSSDPADVKSIVKNFDALHVPSRRRPEPKPKTELKALEYIAEQGFLMLEKR